MDDDEFQVSYMGVTTGVPVLTKDGEQFGILEHVLAVDEEDIFEGIVVWIGGGGWAGRKIQRELSMGHQSAARFLETFRRPGQQGYVDRYGNQTYGGMFGRARWRQE